MPDQGTSTVRTRWIRIPAATGRAATLATQAIAGHPIRRPDRPIERPVVLRMHFISRYPITPALP